MANNTTYRLWTRSDLDGIICAVLLKHLQMVDEIRLIDNPGFLQDKGIEIGDHDITTNLPFVPGVHLAIDHHISESIRNEKNLRHIIDPDAPSAAHVVYNYFGGEKSFPDFFKDMMEAVDKADSGQFSREDILHPKLWVLLNFLLDQRTNIERWGHFRIPEEQFKLNLIDYCRQMTIDRILPLHDVKERADIYFKYEDQYKTLVSSSATVYNNIVVLDFRNQAMIYPGNRFIVYALYPQCNISVLMRRDSKNNKTAFSVGKSILNRTSSINVGELMLSYGGGGHRAAGACQVSNDIAENVFKELLSKLTEET